MHKCINIKLITELSAWMSEWMNRWMLSSIYHSCNLFDQFEKICHKYREYKRILVGKGWFVQWHYSSLWYIYYMTVLRLPNRLNNMWRHRGPEKVYNFILHELAAEDQRVYVKLSLHIQFGYSILYLSNRSLENVK